MHRPEPTRPSLNTHRFQARRARGWLSCLALTLALLVTQAAAQVTVIDRLDREVTLNAPPLRIVSMIPTSTETVCALGACDRIVAVDRHSDHPVSVQELPMLGDAFAPDLERLVAMDPDLVLTDEYSGLADAVANLGIPVYAGTAATIAEVHELIHDIGTLLFVPARAELLNRRLEAEVRALSAGRDPASGPTVLLELDPTPFAAGKGSYLDELLTLAGARNVVPGDAGAFPQLDPETIIRADPEVIVLLDAPYGESAATVAARPGWAAIRAVQDGAVLEPSADVANLLGRPGPRLAEALSELIAMLDGVSRR